MHGRRIHDCLHNIAFTYSDITCPCKTSVCTVAVKKVNVCSIKTIVTSNRLRTIECKGRCPTCVYTLLSAVLTQARVSVRMIT